MRQTWTKAWSTKLRPTSLLGVRDENIWFVRQDRTVGPLRAPVLTAPVVAQALESKGPRIWTIHPVFQFPPNYWEPALAVGDRSNLN